MISRSAIFLCGLAACGHAHHTPAVHRAAPDACSAGRPAFMPGSPNDAGSCAAACACSSDSQCTAPAPLANGRCGHAPLSSQFACEALTCTGCSYDECFSDSDCSATGALGLGICSCRETATHKADSVAQANPNFCAYGNNCRVDADCASTGFPFCSPSPSPTCQNFAQGFFCHTTDDECSDDSDCMSGGIQAVCAWEPSKGHWACASPGLCLDGGA